MVQQNEEIIADAMPRRQTSIHKFPVIAVEEVFLTRGERKAAADSCSNGKYVIENHVTAQVHVLVAVEAHRRPAIQASEFLSWAVNTSRKAFRKNGL